MATTRSQSLEEPRWAKLLDGILETKKDNLDAQNVVLATGKTPSSRYIVHRRLVAPPSSSSAARTLFISTTDIRSQKVSEIAASPRASIVYWTSTTAEQLRLEGHLAVYHPLTVTDTDVVKVYGQEWLDKERAEQFKNLSPKLRASFARSAPGLPFTEHEKAEWPVELPSFEDIKEGKGSKGDEEKLNTAWGNFSLLLLKVEAADYTNLKLIPNERFKWTLADGTWTETEVAP